MIYIPSMDWLIMDCSRDDIQDGSFLATDRNLRREDYRTVLVAFDDL